jgi:hypothetical protein
VLTAPVAAVNGAAIVAVRIQHCRSGHRTQTTALGPAVGAAGSTRIARKPLVGRGAAGGDRDPGLAHHQARLVELHFVPCGNGQISSTRWDLSCARSRAAALIMVFVSVSFLPNGNRTVKELRIGLGIAALLDVIIGGRGFFDRPGRPARAAARAFELGPVA